VQQFTTIPVKWLCQLLPIIGEEKKYFRLVLYSRQGKMMEGTLAQAQCFLFMEFLMQKNRDYNLPKCNLLQPYLSYQITDHKSLIHSKP
jgi:hypothetical protein